MRKKIWIFLLVPVFIILLVTGLFFWRKNAKESMGQGNFQNRETVSASGVTSIGTINETFPVDSLTVGLEIEEVYVASGDTVTTETAILKFTDESVASAREELESLLRTADLKYRAGKIEYEQALINAKYEYEETVLSGKYAKTVYEENIDKISAKIIVNNESQKGIIIGKQGAMLKKIGTSARLELEKLLEKKVFLELFVKVQKNWLKDKNAIKELGFN